MNQKSQEFYKQIEQNQIAKLLKQIGWNELLEVVSNRFNVSDILEIFQNKKKIVIIFSDIQDNILQKATIKVQLCSYQQRQSSTGTINDEEQQKYIYQAIAQFVTIINLVQLKIEKYRYYKYDMSTLLSEQSKEVDEQFKNQFISKLPQLVDFIKKNDTCLINELTPSNIYVCEDNSIILKDKNDIKKKLLYSYKNILRTKQDQFSFLMAIVILMLDNLNSFPFETYPNNKRTFIIEDFKQGKIPKEVQINQKTTLFKISMILFASLGKDSSSLVEKLQNELKTIKINFEEKNKQIIDPPALKRFQSSLENMNYDNKNSASQKNLYTEQDKLITIDTTKNLKLSLNKKETNKQVYQEVNLNEKYYKSSHPSLNKIKSECDKMKLIQLDLIFKFKCIDKKICFQQFSPDDYTNYICQITKNQANLQTLSLKSNRTFFKSEHIKKIADSLKQSNQELINLDFDFQNAYQFNRQFIEEVFANSKKIKTLKLKAKDSHFVDEDLKPFEEKLKDFRNISQFELDFSANIQISELGMRSIIEGLASFCQNLEELILKFSTNDNMKSEAFNNFNIKTSRMTKLKKLHLDFSSNKHFDNNFLEIISHCILQNKSLQDFSINLDSNNLISDHSFEDLLQKLSQCNNLNSLELIFNNNDLITNTSFQKIEYIGKRLKCFKLEMAKNNQLTDYFLNQIGKLIKNSIYIEDLLLNFEENNNFTEQGILLLTQQLSNKDQNSSLKSISLNLSKCQNSNNEWACQIAKNLNFCLNLEKINISLNLNQNNEDNGFNLFSQGLSQKQKLKELSLIFTKSVFIVDPFSDIQNADCAFPNLQILSLKFQNSHVISDQTLINIGKIIGMMDIPKKIELIFTDNSNFTDEGMMALFQNSKFEQNQLEELIIECVRENSITDEGFTNMLKSLSMTDSLKCLILNFNNQKFSDKLLKKIEINLSQTINLEQIKLHFSQSKFTDLGIISLSQFLSYQTKLTKLDLNLSSLMNLSKKSYQFLKMALSKNQNLTDFYLNLSQQYELNDQGFQFLCQGIGCTKSIQNLSLNLDQNNLLTNKSFKYLSAAIIQCEFLRQLDLNFDKNDNINSQGFIDLCNGIKKAKYLSHLTLKMYNNTKIRGEDMKHLAQAFKSKNQLQLLNVNLSKIEGYLSQITLEFVDCVKTLQSLKCFNLEFNSLKAVDSTFMNSLKEGLKECRLLKDLLIDFQNSQVNLNQLKEFCKVFSSLKNISTIQIYCSGHPDEVENTKRNIQSNINNKKDVQINVDTQRQI